MQPTPRWDKLRRAFRLPSTRRRLRQELDDELRFHLEGRIEELMERDGLSRNQADSEARRRFGDYGAYRQQARHIDDSMLTRRHRMEFFDTLRRETQHAGRALLRAPSFSVITIVTLALGLGAATTIYTLLDRVVIRPLPYPHAERMLHVGTLWPKVQADAEFAISKGQYFYFKKNSTTLADMLLYDEEMEVIPGDGDHPPERVPTFLVSANTFSVLGIRPELGHVFAADLERSQDPTAALISHGYWQRRFGGDPSIIGKRLPLSADWTLEIVGVLPPNASLPDGKADIWMRNYLNPKEPPQNNHTHRTIALMKPGATVQAVAAEITGLQNQMMREYPDVYSPSFVNRVGFAMHVTSLRDAIVGGPIARALWLLFAAVGFVLLIAGANVANLFLVRIDARRREAAVRTALGAERSHLAVHYLTESLLLSIAAGLGAIALGDALLHVILAIAPQSLPRVDEVTFDGRSVMFCMTAAMAFGVVFGVLPLISSGVDVGMLRDGGRGLTISRSNDLARKALALAQVALAVVLLAGAALMVKSFARLRGVRPGFDPVGVESMTLFLPSSRYKTAADEEAFWRDLTRRVEALPGVTHAGATDNLPLAGGFGCTGVITDAPGPDNGNCMPMVMVTPGFFETMGIKLRGVTPTWSDVEAGSGPLVVSQAFAKRFWADQNAVGHTVKPFSNGMPSFPVVAVAEDIRGTGLQNPPVEAIYFPIISPSNASTAKWGTGWWADHRQMSLVVRAPNAHPEALVNSIRTIVTQIDPQVPIADIQSMELVVSKSTAETSFTMLVLLIAATIALALSAVGIYGVISYVVGQRRAEIGIRMALGAQVREVSRLIVSQSMRLAGTGVMVGLFGAIAGTRLLRSLLFETSPTDPVVLALTAGTLLVVALIASFGPTRRAAKIDPVEAMRQ
jgi:putative ABC transport system permease protein